MSAEGEFAGKVAVITGGGRGLGKAFGEALAARGATVVLIDLDGKVAAAAAAGMGGRAVGLNGDVADEAGMAALMDRIAAEHGGIDLLINNAGIHSAEANEFIGTLGIARTRRMFDVNVWGVIHCCLAARPHMAGRQGAAVINIASMAAYGAQKAYGVTKLAVRGLTMSFAHEFAGDGIRVNAIAPGLILTDTIRAELAQPVIEHVTAMQIIPRPGEERDIVETMLWLASDRSSFVTGETIRVSGGVTLQI
ncbi:SDR family oxidoreductase [Sphingomonas lacunae]|uniref:SDR family oxidoreductase n=1 Tax=Sphingomonas lacunae TaxID=2698828 RepID=A0A6M4AQY9_9SPHN|nr:SDR family oxidoreductase [Sphingomonas lacunae]QJQ31443.1 SDR family oxidoreductase [Sphingomonas lacunae]